MNREQLISLFYEENSKNLQDISKWTEFLLKSAHLKNYSFPNQVVLLAQNPNLSAVATLEYWNNIGRYINKGTSGLYAFVDNQSTGISKKYFDIADTNGKEFEIPIIRADNNLKKLYACSELLENHPMNDRILLETLPILDTVSEQLSLLVQATAQNLLKENQKMEYLRKQNTRNNSIQNFIVASITTIVNERLGNSEPKDEVIKQFYTELERGGEELRQLLSNRKDIVSIGKIINQSSRQIINQAERGIVNERAIKFFQSAITRVQNNQRSGVQTGRGDTDLSSDIRRRGREISSESRTDNENVQQRRVFREILPTNGRHDNVQGVQPTQQSVLGDRGRTETDNKAEYGVRGGTRHNEEDSLITEGRNDSQRDDKRGNIEVSEQLEEKEHINLKELLRRGNLEDTVRVNVQKLKSIQIEEGKEVTLSDLKKYTVKHIGEEYISFEDMETHREKEFLINEFMENYQKEVVEDNSTTSFSMEEETIEELPSLFDTVEPQTSSEVEEVVSVVKEDTDDIEPAHTKNFYLTDIPEEERQQSVKGAKQRYKDNIEAIKTLKHIRATKLYPTLEEKIITNKYEGWGGLSEVFDESKTSFSNEYKELKELLSEHEYNSAMQSTLTSFYTPNYIIEEMYKTLASIQENAKILDCSMGTGRFFSCLPPHLQNSTLHGIELDSLTSKIARDSFTNAVIHNKGFEEVNTRNNEYDLVISNIPFENFRVNDSAYNKHNFLIHDYFFAKAIDSVREGGVVAFITSSGTLDKQDNKARKYISDRSDFLGAVRLPNNAFQSAGTQVVSDIIFLQKKSDVTQSNGMKWLNIATDDNGLTYNEYFVNNPNMILGTPVMTSGQFGETLTVKPNSENLQELLSRALSSIRIQIPEYERKEDRETFSIIDPSTPKYSYYYDEPNDVLYYREDERLVIPNVNKKDRERIIGLLEIKEKLRELTLAQQYDFTTDSELAEMRQELNLVYDNYVAKHGYVGSKENLKAFGDDIECYFLASCEKETKENKNIFEKETIFFQRTVQPVSRATTTDNVVDAYYICLSERGEVDLAYIQTLYHKPIERIIEELGDLIYKNPLMDCDFIDVGWESSFDYLSGDIDSKIRAIENLRKEKGDNTLYQKQFDKLQEVKPKRIEAGEIEVHIGASWLPQELYNQFMYETFKTPSWQQGTSRRDIHVDFNPYDDTWRIVNKTQDKSVESTEVFGTKRMSAYSIFEKSLNLQSAKVYDSSDDHPVLNERETRIAQGKQKVIEQAFSSWIFDNTQRREELVTRYNRMFNSITLKKYDGSYLKLPNLSDGFTPYAHQKNAVARIMDGTYHTLLSHEVGAGKTATMIIGAMERIRTGQSNRVLITVPNHITQQFSKELYQLYPNAKAMAVEEKDFSKNNRQRFLSKIAMSDVEIIIIGHSQFSRLPMSPAYTTEMIENEISQVMIAMDKKAEHDYGGMSVKQYQKTLLKLRGKLEKINYEIIKDKSITFEELGIDTLMVDEADLFKNGYLQTKMRNVAGINTADSQRANDMLAKVRYITAKNGKIVFATGTPISNALSETYIMQRYLQEDILKSRGMFTFDNWVSTFAKTTTTNEPTPEGNGLRPKTRLSSYYNIPELKNMFGLVSDVVTINDTNIKRPTEHLHIVECQPSEYQLDWMKDAIPRCQDIRNRDVKPDEDNMLKFTNEAKLMSIDERLVDPTAGYNENGKIEKLCQNVVHEYHENQEKKGSQIIFCDKGTPNKDKFNVYDEVKRVLIEKGIPEHEIKFIHEAKNDLQKEKIFSDVRNGDVRVIIASTEKAGAGTNIQKRLCALHDLDAPYRPRDINQRHGRIIRQGNDFEHVNIYQYVTEKTFDAYSWNILAKKQQFISQFNRGTSSERTFKDEDNEVLNFETVQAIATGNPLMQEKIQLDGEINNLQFLLSEHNNQKYRFQSYLENTYPSEKENILKSIEKVKQDIETVKQNLTAEFKIEIDGKQFDERVVAGGKISNIFKAESLKEKSFETIIGTYQGLQISISKSAFSEQGIGTIKLIGEDIYPIQFNIDSEVGIIKRIENAVERLPSILEKRIHEQTELEIEKEQMETQLTKEFPHKDELDKSLERQSELESLLLVEEEKNQPQEVSEVSEYVEIETEEITNKLDFEMEI